MYATVIETGKGNVERLSTTYMPPALHQEAFDHGLLYEEMG